MMGFRRRQPAPPLPPQQVVVIDAARNKEVLLSELRELRIIGSARNEPQQRRYEQLLRELWPQNPMNSGGRIPGGHKFPVPPYVLLDGTIAPLAKTDWPEE